MPLQHLCPAQGCARARGNARSSFFILPLLVSLVSLCCGNICPAASASAAAPYAVLDPASFAPLLGDDLAWAASTAPLFEASDAALTRAFALRLRVLRSHIHETGLADPGLRLVITEFSPDVPWAGLANTIPCAAGHHLAEARWLRNTSVAESYSRWWVSNVEGVRHNYYSWLLTAVRDRLRVEGAAALPLVASLLPNASAILRSYARGELPQNAGFVAAADCLWNAPGNEGQENSISGSGCRPLTQSMLYSESQALSELCAAAGNDTCAAEFAAEAARWRARTLALWNPELASFDTLRIASPDPPPPSPPPPMPRGYALMPLLNNSFCCDQSPCVGGQSTFLFSGEVPPAQCAALCSADARCSFATVSAAGWCMNAQFCNATNPFAGSQAWTFARNSAPRAWPRAAAPYQPRAAAPPAFAGVRELASLSSPWLFGAVPAENASLYAPSWAAAFDPEGLLGQFGLRTAERRHPQFSCAASGCCAWNGPSWPFETSKLIRAAIDVLQDGALAAQVPQLK